MELLDHNKINISDVMLGSSNTPKWAHIFEMRVLHQSSNLIRKPRLGKNKHDGSNYLKELKKQLKIMHEIRKWLQ